ncbi:Protein PAM71, chloroplastic, partial [Mucuna pruriens]
MRSWGVIEKTVGPNKYQVARDHKRDSWLVNGSGAYPRQLQRQKKKQSEEVPYKLEMHSHTLLRSHSLPSLPKPFPSSSSFLLLLLPPSTLRSKRLQSSTLATSSPIFRNETKLRMQGLTRAYMNCNNSRESLAHISNLKFPSAPPLVSSSTAITNSSIGLLKFMLLFGFLTLQDSYPALAASDFSSALNSFPIFGDIGDISTGFASAFLLIFFSELGDKTFFIAALLAARNSAGVVFIGTFGALAAMTLISVVLGRTFHYVDEILPFRFGETDLPIDDIAAVCLLVYFGVSTLLDASSSDGQKTDEEQKEAELAVSEFSGNGAGILSAASTVVSTFLLVFVAEWGDKSFFSTIALAAASSPLGVIAGALAGHGVATLVTPFPLAVLGGSLLGTFLSEKNLANGALLWIIFFPGIPLFQHKIYMTATSSSILDVIAYIGGVLFLVFAAVTLFEIVQ